MAQTSDGIHEMIQIQKISHLFWMWGLMNNFPSKNGSMSIFFKALLAGLTNQHDISDFFAVTPLFNSFNCCHTLPLLPWSPRYLRAPNNVCNPPGFFFFKKNWLQYLFRFDRFLPTITTRWRETCGQKGTMMNEWWWFPWFHHRSRAGARVALSVCSPSL